MRDKNKRHTAVKNNGLKNNSRAKNQLVKIDQVLEVLVDYQDHLKQTLFAAIEEDYKQQLKQYNFLKDCASGNKDLLRIKTLEQFTKKARTSYAAWVSPAMPPYYLYYSKQYREDNVGKKIPKDPLDDVLIWSNLSDHQLSDTMKPTYDRIIQLLGDDKNFREGIKKLKIISHLIEALEADAQLPEDILKNFSVVYQKEKRNIETYRQDPRFRKVLDLMLKFLKALSPLALVVTPRLWQSAGKNTTKKIDRILKKP